MRQGLFKHPEWYNGLNFEARFPEVQAVLHQNGDGHCRRPCKSPDIAKRFRGVPGSSLDFPVPGPYQTRKELDFYMYRAQSLSDYPLENVNAADLAGVMWYLHNEIVPSFAPHRKYNITRIKRFRITMKTTWEFYNVHRRQFAGFVAFDGGRCTVPDSHRLWDRFGFVVGCQHQDMTVAAYQSSSRTSVGECKYPNCYGAVWYSLPGPCPDMGFEGKSPQCLAQMPGGLCRGGAVTGARDCTYRVEDAGEISLDELAGIEDRKEFFFAGKHEYVGKLDAGVGCTFWNGKHDAHLCSVRMERVKALFKSKYPGLPGCDELEEPPCDFDAYYEGEFSWPKYSTPLRQSFDSS